MGITTQLDEAVKHDLNLNEIAEFEARTLLELPSGEVAAAELDST